MINSVQLLASHVGHSGRAISGEGKRKCQCKKGTGGRANEDGGWSNEDEMQQQLCILACLRKSGQTCIVTTKGTIIATVEGRITNHF